MKIKFYLYLSWLVLLQCTAKIPQESRIALDEDRIDSLMPNELQKELAQTIPMTSDELSSFFPFKVGLFLRFEIIGGQNEGMGVSSVESDFRHKDDSSKRIYVEVLDGAGVNGSIFLLSSMERLKIDFEDSNSSERIRVFYHQGYRGFLKENFHQSILEYELIYKDRFRVRFLSNRLEKAELVDFIHKYPLSFLINI